MAGIKGMQCILQFTWCNLPRQLAAQSCRQSCNNKGGAGQGQSGPLGWMD